MEGLEADMDIEQIEMKIARMKAEIARKQQKLLKWEKAAKMMKNTSRSEIQEYEPNVPSVQKNPDSSDDTPGNQEACRGQDDPPAEAENPPCKTNLLASSGNDSSDDNTPSHALPKRATQDSVPKDESPPTGENAAVSAPRRSSRQSRCSYILNSDEFVTLDYWHAKSKKKSSAQVSPEPKESKTNTPETSAGDLPPTISQVFPEQPPIQKSKTNLDNSTSDSTAGFQLVFPEPPPSMAELPIVDFFLPEDEFAAWKIRFRRKTSLRSGTNQVRASGETLKTDEPSGQNEASIMEKPTEEVELPQLSRFESLLSLDTSVREAVELVHCGKVMLGAVSVRAIAAAQNSKISVWTEEDDEWIPQPMALLMFQRDGTYKFTGFNSPSSMGFAVIAETKGERAIWCYDLSPPGRKRCLESLQGRSSCAILCCVVGETLVYAQVGLRGTRLKTYDLDVLGAKKPRYLNNMKDALVSLQPIAELNDAVIGCSATRIYIWNHETGQLCKKMQAPGNSPFQKCTFAHEESGLLVMGVVIGDNNPRHHLVVVNPARHKWRVLREYQDVLELPNQCLQGTTQVGQHLVAGGGAEVGRVAIWNIFSGNLAAFLNDGAVTTVCTFPSAFSRDFLIATGTRRGDVIVYKLPFPQV